MSNRYDIIRIDKHKTESEISCCNLPDFMLFYIYDTILVKKECYS